MLRKQALRGMWRNKRSYSACLILMAVGICIYIAFHLVAGNLSAAMNTMYTQQRFGEAFARVSLMPVSAVDKIALVDGVAQVDATLVVDARVRREDSNRIITLRLSSFDNENQERLNNFLLVSGTQPGDGEILIGEAFAKANGLATGDSIHLVLEGRRIEPVISGLVQSPEYVYAIPDTGQLMPDNEAFGFGYMPADQMGTVLGKSGFVTNLSMTFEEGYSFQLLKPQLEDILTPYGVKSLIERTDQASHVMLDQELESVGTMASSLPSLFVGIAVVILYIMLRRMIEQERTQIGILKAFGFSNASLLLYYMGYGGVIGLAGGLLGAVLGVWMTGALTPVFLEFFSLPMADVPLDLWYMFQGIALALIAGLLGALMGARTVLRLSPSDAMRPPAPPAVNGDLLGRMHFLRTLLTSHGFMSLRNIARNGFRSSFIVLGIAVSFAITAFMASYGEMFDALLFNQFTEVERYNLKVTLHTPASYNDALSSAWSLPGVRRAEAMLELPVELHNGHLSKTVMVTAVEENSSLYRIYDNATGTESPPPYGGVILSSSLAQSLQVKRGDLLTTTTVYTGDQHIPVPVLGVVESNLGATAYIRLDGLWNLVEIGPASTSLLLDAQDPDAVKAALWDAGNVSSITDQEEAMQVYTDMLDSYGLMITMLQLAGMVIAFAIISNTTTISLSERQREYATMRVLGMLPGEIGRIVGLEYWILSLLSLPLGIVLTNLFKRAMAGMIDNELFSIPLHTGLTSFLSAAVLCGVAVFLSNWSARRKIARFDMVSVLKERE